MPTRPTLFRSRPARTKADRDRDHDAQRRAASDTRPLYGTARWKRIAADQIRREPLCRFCFEAGHIALATTCDHVDPHRGDVEAFWRGPFQSLCTPCHSSTKQAAERGRGGQIPRPA